MTARPFTPEEVAERWRCHPSSVRALCRSGVLASFRVGKHYRIPIEALQRFEGCSSNNPASSSTEAAGTPSGSTPPAEHSGELCEQQTEPPPIARWRNSDPPPLRPVIMFPTS